MTRRTVAAAAALSLTLLLAAASVSGFPVVFDKRITVAVPELVAPGFVIFAAPDGVAYAISTAGETVHSWRSPLPDTEIDYAKPLDNGNVLARILEESIVQESSVGAKVINSVVLELDQNSDIVWQYEDQDRLLHHDQAQLPNGNYLLLCNRRIERPEISPEPLIDDCLIEVDQQGEVVWEWQTADHFEEFEFSDDMKARISDHAGDWAHANAASVIPEDVPHDDPRFAAGNIVISYRFINAIVIIDRETGEIVWKVRDISIGQHDTEMLPTGLSGEGNILVFDNGLGSHYNDGGPEVVRSFSRIVEIDPTDLSVPYEYTAADSGFPKWWFWSHFVGSVQRLPNGNTLIGEGMNGRIFEVTAEGRIVWEFVNEVIGFYPMIGNTNRIYRADKVPADWLGLVGVVGPE